MIDEKHSRGRQRAAQWLYRPGITGMLKLKNEME